MNPTRRPIHPRRSWPGFVLWLPAALAFTLGCGAADDSEADGGIETTLEQADELAACSGTVDSVKYYFPLHHSWGTWDQSYEDAPNGLAEYPAGGVMYDYHRGGASNPLCMGDNGVEVDGICSTPGWRDYMGGDVTYGPHNGNDSSIGPSRLFTEGAGEIYPVAAGTVTDVINAALDEDVIAVQHTNGYVSRYVHLRSGSGRVRIGDAVTTNTVLADVGTTSAHLHFDFHDCDYAGVGEPVEKSYYEIYRADKHLWQTAPLYGAGPSEIVDIQLKKTTPPAPVDPDELRYVSGETIQIKAWAQDRKDDTIKIMVLDPSGNVKATSLQSHPGDVERWFHHAYSTSYTIQPGDSVGWWSVQATPSYLGSTSPLSVRKQKFFFVGASPPNANGPVQSAASVVALENGTVKMAAFYRGADVGGVGQGNLKMRKWTLAGGWGTEVDHGGPFLGRPSCVTRTIPGGTIDCFLQGTDNKLWRWFSNDGGANGTFSQIYSTTNVLSDPSAISMLSNMDVIFRKPDSTLGRMSYNGVGFDYASAGSYSGGTTPLACTALNLSSWRCYSKTFPSGLYEIQFTNGIQTGAGLIPGLTLSGWDNLTVAQWPGEGPLTNSVQIVSRSNTAMVRTTRLQYASDASTKWLPIDSIGAKGLTTTPSCGVRPGTRLLECVAANEDHELLKNSWTGARWTGWAPIDRAPNDRLAPSVTVLSGTRLDLFASSKPIESQYATSTTLQRTNTNGFWGPSYSSLGGENRFGPGCTARGGTSIDCFSVTGVSGIVRKTWNGASWGSPTTVVSSSAAYSQISAVSTGSTNLDIFYLNSSGVLKTRNWNGTTWGSEVSLGSPPAGSAVSGPGCVVPSGTTINCLVRQPDNKLAYRVRSSGTWGAWTTIAGTAAFSAPSPVSLTGLGYEVFYRGPDNTLRKVSSVLFGGWGAEETLGGSIASAPACAARQNPYRMDCFAQGFEGTYQDLYHYQYQGGVGWLPPRPVGLGLTNVALKKFAAQSSTINGGVPALAVDGVIDGVYGNGSVTHTNADYHPGDPSGTAYSYWYVDLGAPYSIDHIQVFNRTDCCSQRLDGFVVEYQNEGNSTWWSVPTVFFQEIAGVPTLIDRADPAYPGVAIPIYRYNVRKIRIRHDHIEYMSLAEVLVMARETP